MILGIGTDILDSRRIERTLASYGDRFVQRLFSDWEQQRCSVHGQPANRYAQHFAAKEACAKALGTGFRFGVTWRDIELGSLPSGQPILRLGGAARRRMHLLTPPHSEPQINVSLSDEYPFVLAFVLLSARPVVSIEHGAEQRSL
jgi:holo-[acyl-carrier protein] synthase